MRTSSLSQQRRLVSPRRTATIVVGLLLYGASFILPARAASFRGLGDFPGGSIESIGRDLSGDGTAATGGGSTASSAAESVDSEAFLWTAGGGLEPLSDLAGGRYFSFGTAISADGAVVAGNSSSSASQASLASGDSEGFRWTRALGMVGLGDLSGGIFRSVANDLSGDGSVVVGYSSSAASEASSTSTMRCYEAFRFTTAAGMQGLGDLGTGRFSSQAWAVSANGEVVVGGSDTAAAEAGGTRFHAFRWTSATGMVDIGQLAGGVDYAMARGISEDGSVVVGESSSANSTVSGKYEAFLWANNSMRGIGDLPGGDFNSEALGVSPDGTIVVGRGETAAGDEAFIWTEKTGMRRLQDVLVERFGLTDAGSWQRLSAARAIKSGSGGLSIIGSGTNADGNGEAWVATLPAYPPRGSMLDPRPGFAPAVKFSETFSQSLKSVRGEPGDPPSYEILDHGSTSLTIVASMAGIDPTIISGATEVGFEAGDYSHAARLADADTFKPGKAIFYTSYPDPNDDTGERYLRSGTITYAWNEKTLTITVALKIEEGSIAALAQSGSEGEIFTEFEARVDFGPGSGVRPVYGKGAGKVTTRHVGPADEGEDFDLATVSLKGSADLTPPALSFTSPKDTARIEFSAGLIVEVKGSVKDANRLSDEVLVSLNGGDFEGVPIEFDLIDLGDGDVIESSSSGTWKFPLTHPGTNLVAVKAVDADGSESPVIRRTINLVLPGALTVATVGPGKVTTGFEGTTTKEVGVTYAVTATAAPGAVFNGWSGDIVSDSPTLTFVMTDGLHLEAHFVANPYDVAALVGSYHALLTDDPATNGGHGFLALKMTKTGAFTGSVVLGGVRQTLKGLFTGTGRSTTFVKLKDGTFARLAITLLSGSREIDVTLQHHNIVSTGGGGHEAFDAKHPYTGPRSFTVLVPPPAGASNVPPGDGFGILTISKAGLAKSPVCWPMAPGGQPAHRSAS